MTAALLLSAPSGSRLLQRLQIQWNRWPGAPLPQRAQQPAEAAVIPATLERHDYARLVPAQPFQTSVDAGLFNPAGRWLA
jgi:hypothetical protein